MSDSNLSKCPYCGAALTQKEDGCQCSFCNSFFPYEAESLPEGEACSLSQLEPQVIENRTAEAEPKADPEDQAFARKKARNELIGILTALASCPFMLLFKTMKLPYLLIPGFALWIFSAAFTGFQVYQAKKAGKKAAWGRIFGLLLVALLMLAFIHPVGE